MTAPTVAVRGEVIPPSAVAGKTASAVFALGQVLKELIHGTPAAFQNENDQLGAARAVDKFISAFVQPSEFPALNAENTRAVVEDVSLRPPPAGVAYTQPTSYPAINYDLLADALVRAQARISAESAPEVVTETPAPEE